MNSKEVIPTEKDGTTVFPKVIDGNDLEGLENKVRRHRR